MGSTSNTSCILIVLAFLVISFQVAYSDMVDMKVVQEPKTYSWQQPNLQAAMNDESQLNMRVKPAPFSGPPHLQSLANRCFNKTIGKYRYHLCPYSNLTQMEQDVYWNPYMGVLGVWNGWVINGSQFEEMKFLQGDQCGVAPRESRVVLTCGNEHKILSVTEYSHCKYRLHFSTPLVCHNHSLLVYPTLSEELRHAWDLLHTELHNEDITQKGYDIELTEIFQRAGYLGNEPSDDSKQVQSVQQEQAARLKPQYPFNDVHTCNQQYEDLKKRLNALEEQLNRQSRVNEPDLQEIHK